MRSGTRTSLSRWLAALAGAAAAHMLLGIWYLLYGLRIGPFPPYDLADLVIRLTPGPFATWSIETLEQRAQPLLVAFTYLAVVGLWSVAGVAIRNRPRVSTGLVFGLLQAPCVVALAHWESPRGIAGLIWLALSMGVALAVSGATAAWWVERLVAEHHERAQATANARDWLAQPGTSSRRALLRQIMTTAVVVGAGGSLAGTLLRRAGVNEPVTAAGQPLETVRYLAMTTGLPNVVSPGAVSPATAIEVAVELPFDVRPRITSTRDFYVVDISFRKPVIPETDWRLRIHGLVERELHVTYADLLAEPAVDLFGTLMCISYTHANDLMSSTAWTGVPLRQLLAKAGLRAGIVDVVVRGPGGYSDSIPLADAMAEHTLLAYGMNGTTLPREHGFPCRLYVPGLYGEKNVKWVQEIELVDYDYKGYWQERGWTDIAIVNTMSAIDTPVDIVDSRQAGEALAGGVAFAGRRGVQAIEVRIDDGDWQRAELEPYAPALLWQRWRFRWQPEPGPHTLTVRCIDGEGVLQTAEIREPHPDGMTGLHAIDFVTV